MKIYPVKTILPYLIAIIVFLVLIFAYFSPMLSGKQIKASDTVHFQGMSKEIVDHEEKTGEKALWTNSMFGGMPTYLISTPNSSNLTRYIHRILSLWNNRPASFLFLYFIGFYIALLAFRVNPWLSIVGSIAFAFSTYFFIIIIAGHSSKAFAIAYMPPIVAGVYLAFNGRRLLGVILTGLFLSLQLLVNHLQITYYTLLILTIFGIYKFIDAVLKKELPGFFKTVLVLLIPLILAIGTNLTGIWTTYEYGKYSTRGESELSNDSENKTKGLDKDYILNDYSYGIAESFNLFIPNLVGGAHSNVLGTKSETYQTLRQMNVPNAREIVNQLPAYWGPQRYTAGPMYIGAVVIFLFFFGCFFLKYRIKWWLIAATVLSVLLAWGNHFYLLSDLFIDYIPGYNKFRTVSTILVMAEFSVPLLAILAIKKLLEGEHSKQDFFKAFKWALMITGGIAFIFLAFPGIFLNFRSPADQNYVDAGWPQILLDSMADDRKQILQTDAFRSLIFVLLTAGLLLAFQLKKISLKILYILLALILLLDLWPVNKRYLNNDHFVTKKEAKNPYTATIADTEILSDPDLSYRVLDLASGNPFSDSRASYFHKSIGGYHGAKMKRYNELVEFHIGGYLQNLINVFRNDPTPESIDRSLQRYRVLNMLNNKYIIINPVSSPILNTHALGNSWFIEKIRLVENADEEIAALGSFDPAREVIVDKRFESYIKDLEPGTDTAGFIRLLEYQPDYLVYESNCSTPQIAVFSEIFYEKGWNAYVDDELTSHFRVNYILRGMVVPEGSHTIKFRFEPSSYYTGRKISLACSTLLILLLIGIPVFVVSNKLKKEKEMKTDD